MSRSPAIGPARLRALGTVAPAIGPAPLRILVVIMLCVGVAVSAATAQAAVLAQWQGSSRSWNASGMSTLKTTLQTAGHVVKPDSPLSAPALADAQVVVIGEPSGPPSAPELAALAAFVQGGGALVLLADVGINPTFVNGILTGVGSSMFYTSANPSNAPIIGGSYASDGPPYQLAGMSLAVTSGVSVFGGNLIAGPYVHYEKVGAGMVFAFGDRLDHNSLNPIATTVNGELFLNIAAAGVVPDPFALPTLSSPALTLLAMTLAIAALATIGRRI